MNIRNHLKPDANPDDRPLDDDRRGLASDPDALAMARRLARRFASRFPGKDDEFESAAMLGVVRAAALFDFRPDVKFSTFANRIVVGQIYQEMVASMPKGYRHCSRREGMPTAFDGEAIDRAESGHGPVGWEFEYHDELRALARKAGGKAGKVLVLLYGHADTATVRQASEKMGLQYDRTNKLHKIGIATIRDHYGLPATDGAQAAKAAKTAAPRLRKNVERGSRSPYRGVYLLRTGRYGVSVSTATNTSVFGGNYADPETARAACNALAMQVLGVADYARPNPKFQHPQQQAG